MNINMAIGMIQNTIKRNFSPALSEVVAGSRQ